MIESVAVVEKRGDAEVVGQVPDDFHGAGNEVLAAVPYRSDLVRALAGTGQDDRAAPWPLSIRWCDTRQAGEAVRDTVVGTKNVHPLPTDACFEKAHQEYLLLIVYSNVTDMKSLVFHTNGLLASTTFICTCVPLT